MIVNCLNIQLSLGEAAICYLYVSLTISHNALSRGKCLMVHYKLKENTSGNVVSEHQEPLGN